MNATRVINQYFRARDALALGRALCTQAIIQAVTALSGIIVVRLLDTREYAFYAIAASAVAALTALSNCGVVDAMTAIGGRGTADAARLSRLVATALSLRRIGALIAGVPILSLLVWMLARNGASGPTILSLLVVVGLFNLAELNYSIHLVVPWLRGFVRSIQRIEFEGALVRFGWVMVLPVLMPRAEIAVASGAAALAIQTYLLDRRGLAPAPHDASVDPILRQEIVAIVRRQWLNDVNTLLQGQASLWLLTVFAGTASVAAFGALGRVSIVFTIITMTLHRAVLFRYARAQERDAAIRTYCKIVGVYLGLAVVPAAVFLACPTEVLRILGPNYAGLEPEFRLFTINALLSSFATLTMWLNATRGWIFPAPLMVVYQTGWLLFFVLSFGAGRLGGVVLAGIGVNLMLVLANVAYSWVRFRRMDGVGLATASAS